MLTAPAPFPAIHWYAPTVRKQRFGSSQITVGKAGSHGEEQASGGPHTRTIPTFTYPA